jgi:predicted component of type VI protein secretion system
MEALAIEQEIAAFEAKLAAELAEEALERELAEFETQLEEELANQAALAKFLAALTEERAAAASSTAAYQSKLAYDARVAKIMEDLVKQLEEVIEHDDYKSDLVEELIAQATAKLEEEKFIGAISGEIVTVAIHEFCQDTLNLSESNIALFKKALAGGYLGNVGPQVKYGTEFTANRWDKYITCVGSLGN